MRFIRWLGLALVCLAGLGQIRAASPEDQFVSIYELLQRGDALRGTGRVLEARDIYEQARTALLKLQADYPNWNPKIINYRLNYIAERIGPPPTAPGPTLAPPSTPAVPTPGPPTETAPVVTAPAPTLNAQIIALETEVKNLTRERNLLQAKLREALAVQPAAVDPRELAKADQRIKELTAENDRLQKELARQQDRLAHAADPAALDAAQKALKDALAQLARQTNAVAKLTLDKATLQQELRIQTERARARAARAQPRVSPPPRTTTPINTNDLRIAELTGQLSQVQRALAAEQSRSDALRAEKAALEKRVAELTKAPTTPAAAPGMTATSATGQKAKPPTPKQARAAEKEKLRLVERERDDLRKRVNALARELEDRRVPRSAAAREHLTEELAILRARVQVYEARQVPLTPEEMALFKQTAGTVAKIEQVTIRRPTRQLPAAAAALVADAQRALRAGRFEEAEQKFKQALTQDERNIVLLSNLAATYLDANRLEDADAALRRALAVDPNDPQSLALQGLLRFRQAKYDEALNVLTRAATLDPDNALTQNYLGVTLSEKGQRQPAETALRRAIQIDPNYAEAHHNLAVVYATQKPPALELARWHYQKGQASGQPKNPALEKLLQLTPATEGGK